MSPTPKYMLFKLVIEGLVIRSHNNHYKKLLLLVNQKDGILIPYFSNKKTKISPQKSVLKMSYLNLMTVLVIKHYHNNVKKF